MTISVLKWNGCSRFSFVVVFWILLMVHQNVHGWLFYSPASKEQTINDCKRLQIHNSPFYPSYCNRLLRHAYNLTESSTGANTDSTSIRPSLTLGWGWGPWGEWLQEACPDVCGRRCRRRIRSCHGPYHLACSGQGKAEDFDNCPALNNPATTSFQRSTTRLNFELYSTIPTTLEDQVFESTEMPFMTFPAINQDEPLYKDRRRLRRKRI